MAQCLPRQDPRSWPDPQQGKPSSPPGVCPATLGAQSPGLMDSGNGGVGGSGTRGLGGLNHSPDCRMMPLSVSLTSSLLSMVGFWEEGARRRRGRHPSQPRPGHGGGLEFPQLLKEQQKMTEVKLQASRQSGLVRCMRVGLRSGDLASGGGRLGVGQPRCWVTRPWPTVTPPAEKQHRRLHPPLASGGWARRHGLHCLEYPGKSTGVGCHFLLSPRLPAQPPLASGGCRCLHCFSAGGVTVGFVAYTLCLTAAAY